MNKKHKIGLDYIRLFAMLAVILVHIGGTLNVPEKVLPFFSWGAAGVQFFFVLSGYLTANSFQEETKAKNYYMKRGMRIIPAYYTMIFLAMFYNNFVLSGLPRDVYHIGWFRYFLGINMLVPSANFDIWNNMYGLWTMSCFIWFYILAPIIFKFVRSFKRAICFFAISVGIAVIWKMLNMLLFSNNPMLEKIEILSGGSPFGTLYQFSVGIIIYFMIREKKEDLGLIFLAALAVCGMVLHKDLLIWCCICGILITGLQNIKMNCKWFEKCIVWLSAESFHIYLAHILAFDYSLHIVMNWKLQGVWQYIGWFILSVIVIMFLCFLMDFAETVAERLVHYAADKR